MEHYIYLMRGDRPDPLGSGDTKSWFYYYKWPEEGEVFLPLKPPNADVKEGDRLWLFMDDALVGSVVVTRIDTTNETLSSASQELWFDAGAKQNMTMAWEKREHWRSENLRVTNDTVEFARVINPSWRERLLSFLEEGT